MCLPAALSTIPRHVFGTLIQSAFEHGACPAQSALASLFLGSTAPALVLCGVPADAIEGQRGPRWGARLLGEDPPSPLFGLSEMAGWDQRHRQATMPAPTLCLPVYLEVPPALWLLADATSPVDAAS